MDRKEFEAIRDVPGKVISEDVRFTPSAKTNPVVVAENVRIENAGGLDLRLNASHNAETGAKKLNVHAMGVGPICRLESDGPPHRPHGRSHKHALETPRCPDQNLRKGVVDRPELSGYSWRRLFQELCDIAGIQHTGAFFPPDESEGET